MIENINALDKIKKLKDNSQDIIFADPPYALGSEVYIDKEDGKPKYKIAKDFMDKWDMPDHNFWEEFFKEVNRVLKYGGRCILFGIDRQLMLFQYYATMGGLQTNQSLYWAVASSFPKATDVSKMIDKKLGLTREVVGFDEEKQKKMAGSCFGQGVYLENGFNSNNLTTDGACIITRSNSELGQKYEGYKYSISPFKQTLETIMVFQKETKTKSILNDLFAYENGDLEISPSIWDIQSGRVPIEEDNKRANKNYQHKAKAGLENGENKNNQDGELQNLYNTDGRYPSQLFINEEMANILDEQSGILKSGARKSCYIRKGKNPNGTYGKFNEIEMDNAKANEGGLSRFFHQIGYLEEDLDLLKYSSKVSNQERNYGLDNLESIERENGGNNQGTRVCETCGLTDNGTNNHSKCSGKFEYKLCKPLKNNHPTLKPIKLIYKLAELLKTPNKQNVFFPFAGSGSEIIGFILAGFDKNNFEASELSKDYINIANERVKAWEKIDLELFLNKKKIIKRV